MKPRSHSPTKLDVAAFAQDGAHLEGEWPATALERLAESAAAEAPASGWPAVLWSLDGEIRKPRGAAAELWLHLSARSTVALTCQRCLSPVTAEVAVDHWLRFVEGEAQAAELDAQGDEDVLALPRHLDARELIEDELLLALPLVPRHEVCPEPLPVTLGAPEPDEGAEADRPHPFAKLAALKRGGGST